MLWRSHYSGPTMHVDRIQTPYRRSLDGVREYRPEPGECVVGVVRGFWLGRITSVAAAVTSGNFSFAIIETDKAALIGGLVRFLPIARRIDCRYAVDPAELRESMFDFAQSAVVCLGSRRTRRSSSGAAFRGPIPRCSGIWRRPGERLSTVTTRRSRSRKRTHSSRAQPHRAHVSRLCI